MLALYITNQKLITNNKQTVEVAEDFGCASDCVRKSRSEVFEIAYDLGDHPNDYRFYMEIYMSKYRLCYSNC